MIKILPNSDVRGEYYYMYFCICICVFVFVYLCAKSLYISEDVRGRESAISATSGGWQEGLAEHYYCVWIGPHKGALGAQHHSSYCHPLPFNNTKQLYYCFVYSCYLLWIFIVILVTPINNNVTIEFLKWQHTREYQRLRFGDHPDVTDTDLAGYITYPCLPPQDMLQFYPGCFCFQPSSLQNDKMDVSR